MQKGDIRAVENPITAIFALADDVNQQAPTIHKVVTYSRIFIGVWLFVDVVLMVSLAGGVARLFIVLLALPLFLGSFALRWSRTRSSRAVLFGAIVIDGAFIVLLYGEAFFVAILMVSLFVLGVIILNMMREVRSFLDYYALRHRAIKSVRDEDPVVYVPQGKDSVQRLLNYLSERSPDVRELTTRKGMLQTPGLLKGRSGMLYSFDAYVQASPSPLWRLLGFGYTGYSIFVKSFESAPKAQDIAALKRAVVDISAETKIPPSRVIALWRMKEEEGLEDEAYDLLTKETVTLAHRGHEFSCSLELITENPDGTYDFIPYISAGLYGS